jgi:prepilin peptidase CpaA
LTGAIGDSGSPSDILTGLIMVIDLVRLMLFPTLMAFAAASDLLTMTISNRVSIILVAGFFALALMSGMSMAEVLSHAGAAALVLVVSFGFFARGWIGGGDAKLAAATAMWFGFAYLMNYLVYASLLGGALTLLLIEFRLVPLPGVLAGQFWAQRLHRQDGDIPYGIALAGAALLVYPETPWMKAIGL